MRSDRNTRICQCIPIPVRELGGYPHKNIGFGMNAKIQLILNNQGDDFFRPDDICTAPDGRLYFSDWYDGMLGGHAYNNPDQGRIFVLTPKDKSLKRLEKPGPYDNVTDAIEGIKSPNLATQFVARERLLAEGSASVQALEALLTDSEPNHRARALWVLDRIGGESQQRVVAQLQSNDPAIRALAVRILRRHGQQHADAILALADDSSPEVRREILLAVPKLQGNKALAALVKIASTYDGTDRYQLEAINIAANDRKLELYNRLQQEGHLSLQQLPLLQLLNPQAAGELLTAKLSDKGIDQKVAKVLLETAGNAQAIDSGRIILDLVANESLSVDLAAWRSKDLQAIWLVVGQHWPEMKNYSPLFRSCLTIRRCGLPCYLRSGSFICNRWPRAYWQSSRQPIFLWQIVNKPLVLPHSLEPRALSKRFAVC